VTYVCTVKSILPHFAILYNVEGNFSVPRYPQQSREISNAVERTDKHCQYALGARLTSKLWASPLFSRLDSIDQHSPVEKPHIG